MKRRASRVRRAERRRGFRPPEVERGSGTAQMAAVSLVLLVVVGALAVVIGYLAALNEARGAADLVALSAAAERVRGADACRAARSTASANQVAVTGCRVVGDTLDFVVVVTVARSVRFGAPVLPQRVQATARAGRTGLG
ncbi:MAG TPA: hypothetical protein PLL50_06940 [Propionicimonas sp.]|mgnify:CR=1 FL=1|nr:hypothetical protein [Propionicimonas sp.]HQD96906.1 hypothetical protein [Propionicimonas sp.]